MITPEGAIRFTDLKTIQISIDVDLHYSIFNEQLRFFGPIDIQSAQSQTFQETRIKSSCKVFLQSYAALTGQVKI